MISKVIYLISNKRIVTFKESKIISTNLAIAMIGFLVSFVPKESWTLALINEFIAFLSFILSLIFWRKNRDFSVRYFSLLSYVLMIVLSIFFVEPIFRMFYGTSTFWIQIFVLISIIIASFPLSKKTAMGFIKPTKYGIFVWVISGVVIGLGSIVYRITLYAEIPDAFPIAIVCYLFSLLLLFISPIMLIKPHKIEEMRNGSNVKKKSIRK